MEKHSFMSSSIVNWCSKPGVPKLYENVNMSTTTKSSFAENEIKRCLGVNESDKPLDYQTKADAVL